MPVFHRLLPKLAGVAALVVLVLIFEVLIATAVINPYIVPRPSEIILAFERVIVEEGVVGRFLITTGEALTAGLLVSVIGIGTGVLLFRVRLLRLATQTWIASMAAAPIVLAYPLFLVIFGRSPWTIIAIATLSGLPPVILMTLTGLSAVRPALINVGRSFRLTGWQQFSKVLMPAALPSVFAGIRIGLIFAMINVVGVEFLINFGGLGPLINELAERYDLPGTYAAICFVILVSVIFFIVIERIEQWLRPTS
jgi:NitT/TauT family transport system permease protein